MEETGQKGSATIFEPSMRKTEIRGVDSLYENLNKIQLMFAKHIKNKWSWFYDEEEKSLVNAYPSNVNEDDVLKIAGASMKNNSSKGKKRGAIMTAWGLLFKRMTENACYYRSWNNCQASYNNFIRKIDSWVASVDNIDWGDLAIKGLLIGGTIALSVALPEVTAALKISAIVGVAAAGAIVGGLTELHARISRGEKINWGSVLTRTFGGALKGVTLTIPGVGVLARVGAYASIAGTENYWDSSLKGDSSVDALVQSYAIGAGESVCANTINCVANDLLGKFAGGGKVKNEINEVRIKELTSAELEEACGASINPDWKPSGNKGIAAPKSGEIVLPKVKSYEQARNKIFEQIGDDLTGLNSEPCIGRLESSMGYDKIIGRISKDGKLRWRLDYDAIKGPHIHIDDFRLGKGPLSKKIAIPFEGTEETFASLLKHLNK